MGVEHGVEKREAVEGVIDIRVDVDEEVRGDVVRNNGIGTSDGAGGCIRVGVYMIWSFDLVIFWFGVLYCIIDDCVCVGYGHGNNGADVDVDVMCRCVDNACVCVGEYVVGLERLLLNFIYGIIVVLDVDVDVDVDVDDNVDVEVESGEVRRG